MHGDRGECTHPKRDQFLCQKGKTDEIRKRTIEELIFFICILPVLFVRFSVGTPDR